ncbi:MAG: lipid-A-disaccharide synthase, partial [Bacteroidota bacterium]
RVVEELIQADVNKERLVTELRNILSAEGRNKVLADYDLLRSKLGDKGASRMAAALMIKHLQA